MVGVVALIGNRGSGFETVDESLGKGDVVALARRANQAD
jgi:hypothetical protein